MTKLRCRGSIALLCLSLAACQQLEPPDPLIPRSELRGTINFSANAGKDVKAANAGSLVVRFQEAAQQARDNRTKANTVVMMEAGMNLADARCQVFFRAIGQNEQYAGFASKELQIIATGLLTGLNIAGASASTIAGVGAAAAALAATLTNFRNEFHFSPEVSAVETIVRKAHMAFRAAVSADRQPETVDDAVAYLIEYQSLCQPHTIKRLINEAVQKGTPVAQFSNDDTISNAATVSAETALARKVGLVTLSLEQITALIWLESDGAGVAKVNETNACQLLAGTINTRCTQPATAGGVKEAIRIVFDLRPKFWTEKVATARDSLKAPKQPDKPGDTPPKPGAKPLMIMIQ